MVACGARVSDQAEVWADIADKAVRLNAASRTSAMEALYEGHAMSVDRFVASCRHVERQAGAVFAIDGRIAGLELFDCASLMRRLLPKIVRGYAIDAIHRQLAGAMASGEREVRPLAERFTFAVAVSWCTTAPAVGLGTDVRLSSPGITGAALMTDHIVHLSAFAG
jgi:hypothetical protein